MGYLPRQYIGATKMEQVGRVMTAAPWGIAAGLVWYNGLGLQLIILCLLGVKLSELIYEVKLLRSSIDDRRSLS